MRPNRRICGKRMLRRPGFTITELIIVIAIISTLAVVAIPMVETSVKREREIILKRSLREIRTALDDYHDFVIKNKIQHDEETYGYPENLDMLVKGLEYRDKQNNLYFKFHVLLYEMTVKY